MAAKTMANGLPLTESIEDYLFDARKLFRTRIAGINRNSPCLPDGASNNISPQWRS